SFFVRFVYAAMRSLSERKSTAPSVPTLSVLRIRPTVMSPLCFFSDQLQIAVQDCRASAVRTDRSVPMGRLPLVTGSTLCRHPRSPRLTGHPTAHARSAGLDVAAGQVGGLDIAPAVGRRGMAVDPRVVAGHHTVLGTDHESVVVPGSQVA